MRRRLLLAVALAAVLAMPAVWRLLQGPATEAPVSEEEPPRYRLEQVRWVRLDPLGQPEFEAAAQTMEYFADDAIRLREVRVDTPPGPRGGWHLEANQGLAPPRERRLLLTDNVLATGELQEVPIVVYTEKLWLDLLRRELRTEEAVAIASPERTAQANGLRADFDGERLELLRDVKVRYAPDA